MKSELPTCAICEKIVCECHNGIYSHMAQLRDAKHKSDCQATSKRKFNAYLPTLENIAKRHQARHKEDGRITYDDLYQAGAIALWHVIQTLPSHLDEETTYIARALHCAVKKEAYRARGFSTDRAGRGSVLILAAKARLKEKGIPSPTQAELAAAINASIQQLEVWQGQTSTARQMQFHEADDGESEANKVESRTKPDSRCHTKELIKTIASVLNERDRKIFLHRYYMGQSTQKLTRIFKAAETTIRGRVIKALAKIRERLAPIAEDLDHPPIPWRFVPAFTKTDEAYSRPKPEAL